MRNWGINGRQQRVLLQVRGKLALRQFIREPGKLLGLIIAALLFFPFVLGLSFLTVLGYGHLPDPWPAQLLGMVLTLLWLGWMLYPVLFATLNEGLDTRRLLVYPLSGRDLAVSVVVGTVTDYITYVVLPLFVAVLIGWGRGWVWLLLLPALLLAYGHMILASQLVLTVFGGIFQSRRFRDVVVVLGSLLGASCYLLQYAGNVAASFGDVVTPEQLVTLRPLRSLQWLPPGAVARSVEQATLGNWGMALAWLGYAAVLLLLVGWLWWWLLRRLSTGHGFLLNVTPGKKVELGGKTAVLPPNRRWHWLPDDVVALTVKELKAIWRTPQRRVGLFWGALLPLLMFGPFLAADGLPETVPAWLGLLFPVYVLFSMWTGSQNMLGLEGRGLAALLLLPLSRTRFFVAKTVALLLTGLPMLLLLAGVLHWLAGGWLAVAGTLLGVAELGVALGGTAVGSVLFPYPVDLEKGSGGNMLGGGGGCLTALGNVVLVPLALGLLSSPFVAGLAWAYWQSLPWLGYGIGIASIPYGLWLYWLGVRWAGRLLLQREADILPGLLS